MLIPQRGGLPHSDTSGSKPARGSPKIFAACHVLHRLLAPRHPPDALLILNARGSSQSSVASSQKRTSSRRPQPPQSLAQDPSNRCQNLQTDPINSHTHTITSPKNLSAWPGITMDHKSDPGTTHRTPRLPAIDLATTTCTRAIPHAPEDATEPDSQLPKNTSTLTNS